MTQQAPLRYVPSASTNRAPHRDKHDFNKLQKRLAHHAGRAIADYGMIRAGERVMVCLSGGKDSYTLLEILLGLRARAPIDFEIIAMNLDQKQPGFPAQVLPEYLDKLGVEHHIISEDTYSIVKDKIPEGKTTCGLCSRLRRGIIYRVARELGATRIALGHHADDIVETLLLNLFYGGKMKSMPPLLRSDDGRNTVIRPLAYCRERDIERFAEHRGYPIIPCNLCGSQDNLQRQAIKQMLAEWDERHPGRVESMLKGLQDVVPSHLMDRQLFDFAALGASDTSGG